MREIKYRGRCTDLYEEPELVGQWICAELQDLGDFFTKVWNGEISDVGEYTGLKDKHGKEIYEGDIVKYHSTERDILADTSCESCGTYEEAYKKVVDRGVVVYHSGSFSIGLNYGTILKAPTPEQEDLYIPYHQSIHHTKQIEVIGNIHENPELLEADK